MTIRGLQAFEGTIAQAEKVRESNQGSDPAQRMNALSVFSQSLFRSYQANSAVQMQGALTDLASKAQSGQDFVKRVDEEITPQYKLNILTSQAHSELMAKVPAVASGIDESQRKNILNMAGAVLSDNITKLQSTSLTYDSMLEKTREMRDQFVQKYGEISPVLNENINTILENAQRAYANDENGKVKREYTQRTTRNFLLGDKLPTKDEAVKFLDSEIKSKIEVQGADKTWAPLFSEAIQAVGTGMASPEAAKELVQHYSEYMTKEEQSKTIHASAHQMQKNIEAGVKIAEKVGRYVADRHSLGIAVPEDMPVDSRQKEANDFLLQNDAARMSIEELQALNKPEITSQIIARQVADFALNFPKALEDRQAASGIPPITMFGVFEEGVTGFDLFLADNAQRVSHALGAELFYGEDATANIYSERERQEANIAFKQMQGNELIRNAYSLLQNQITAGRTVDKAVGDVVRLTGDSNLAPVLRTLLDSPAPKTGNISQAMIQAYETYKNMDVKLKKELNGVFNSWVQNPVGSNAEDRVMDFSLTTPQIRAAMQQYLVGSNPDSTDEEFAFNSGRSMFFWTNPYGQPGQPSDSLTEGVFPNYAARVPSMVLSEEDFSLLNAGIESNFVVRTDAAGEKEVVTILELLQENPNLTVRNRGSSFRDFEIMEFNPITGTLDFYTDQEGKKVNFKLSEVVPDRLFIGSAPQPEESRRADEIRETTYPYPIIY